MRLLTELFDRFPPLQGGVLRRLQFYQLMVEIERRPLGALLQHIKNRGGLSEE